MTLAMLDAHDVLRRRKRERVITELEIDFLWRHTGTYKDYYRPGESSQHVCSVHSLSSLQSGLKFDSSLCETVNFNCLLIKII